MKNVAILSLTYLAVLFSLMPFAETTIVEPPQCCRALSNDPDAHICQDRCLTFFLPQTIPYKSFLLTIDHRGSSPAFENPFRDFMGFDNGGLKISLGLRYSPIEKLDVGFRRSNNVYEPWDTYEFDGRYKIFDESTQLVDGAAIGGFTWFYQDNSQDASGFYMSGLLGKSFKDLFYLSSGIIIHTNSTYMTKQLTDDASTTAIPITFIFSPKAGLSLEAEMALPVLGYRASNPSYSIGAKYATWRHSFSILFTTSQYTTFDGVVTGAGQMDKPVLGFLITRSFGGEN